MSTSPEPKKSALGGLSTFQVVAGALAAMVSAWIASFLGVAGTIVGAALGSLVVTISSAFFASTLDRGRDIVTAAGTSISTATGTHPVVTDADDADAASGTLPTGSVWERIRWKTVAITSAVVLVIALLAIGGYEIVTQRAYGADSSNNRITTPFSHSDNRSSDDGDTGDDDPTPTPDPTSSATDEPTPDPTESATPNPSASPSPTRSAPRPTRTPTAPATEAPDAE